jgi:catechol 2,3-dioxygenase-like lactoylglutathione lyase family enzyme
MVLNNYSSAIPVVGTEDVLATLSYFEDKLGFERQFVWGDPPVYAGVRAGEALLYITHDPALAAAIRDRNLEPEIFIWVNDIETIYAYHQANAKITEPLTERPWGVRQYVVREPSGYRLKIAECINEPEETQT